MYKAAKTHFCYLDLLSTFPVANFLPAAEFFQIRYKLFLNDAESVHAIAKAQRGTFVPLNMNGPDIINVHDRPYIPRPQVGERIVHLDELDPGPFGICFFQMFDFLFGGVSVYHAAFYIAHYIAYSFPGSQMQVRVLSGLILYNVAS